jgi:hypothetical protein
MPDQKPDVMLDINKGIKDLLAAKKITDSSQLADIARFCCLQICHCCLQIRIDIDESLDDAVKKVVDRDKFEVK